jgi:WD repeat-containing protein 91
MESSVLRSSLSHVDVLVLEYLRFRGFAKTLKSFEGERKGDKLFEFQVEKVVEELVSYTTSFDINALDDLWSFLGDRFGFVQPSDLEDFFPNLTDRTLRR